MAIFTIRTGVGREEQVMDSLSTNAQKAEGIHALLSPHGVVGYIFVEAASRMDAEIGSAGVPYARGILPGEIPYAEIEHMLEQVKVEMNVHKNDIVEIISGAFKRENAKVMRINRQKEEIVVELLESAVPIPITVKMDAVKVIRREGEDDEE